LKSSGCFFSTFSGAEKSTNTLLADYRDEDVLGEFLDGGPIRNPRYVSGNFFSLLLPFPPVLGLSLLIFLGQVFLQPVLDMFLVTTILNNELMPVILKMMNIGVLQSFALDSDYFKGVQMEGGIDWARREGGRRKGRWREEGVGKEGHR
jgi:hypothetical protein